MEEVSIQKVVYGGQGLAELRDGRKVFVWNALPGETVRVRIVKKKRSYAEAIAEEVLVASPEREHPREAAYLATSPWQIMTCDAENRYKTAIVDELFTREKVSLPPAIRSQSIRGAMATANDASHRPSAIHDEREWRYRNKMEYSFWGDDSGLHLALHKRGSHTKQVVHGSELAMVALDEGAQSVLHELRKMDIRAASLKTIIVRCSQNGDVVVSLYTKLEEFPKILQPKNVKGVRVYHSNPKSPASVPTRLLYELGDATLTDKLLGKVFHYDVESFFQVNLPMYEKVLARIKEYTEGWGNMVSLTDMYAGVGSIGLSVARQSAQLIELDSATAAMARVNASESALDVEVVEASSENALSYIVGGQPVVFDPPRAGLHTKVVTRCLEVLPPYIVYLSCNPATQARDVALLQQKYDVVFIETYNFFPRTPHIETLVILRIKP